MNAFLRHSFAVVMSACLAVPAVAQTSDESSQEQSLFISEPVAISDFLWTNRPIVVFADSPFDPRYIEQIDLLEAELSELADRDVVILTDTDPTAETALRTQFRPRGFMMVLIGKDGGVKLRKPFPWDVREISRVIDKMPMRQQEIRDRRAE